MALPTPQYNLKEYPEVYSPREDSYLFLDALESEISFMHDLNPSFILEVGSGSGIIITALSNHFKSKCAFFATDINKDACLATVHTAGLNGTLVEVCNMNLFENFRNKCFDVILFNPPYVITGSEELNGYGLNRAWAGGHSGRDVINIFLKNLPSILSKNGVCYMVAIKENNLSEIEDMVDGFGYKMLIVKQRKVPGEHLFILKFFKSCII